MNDEVELVKNKTDIVSLIGESVRLIKAGRHYKALCPFHSEKTPSFTVSPELQIFKCFGCGESGDCFSFLQKYEGMDFYDALKILAEKAGVELSKRQENPQSFEKELLREINTFSARFYNFILLNHKAGSSALKYLVDERGVKKEVIEEFMLGYSPNDSRALISFLTKKKKFNFSDIQKAGILVKGRVGFSDRFRGRVTFPLFDPRGNAVALAGRILPQIEKNLPQGIHVGKYINSPETPIYHKGGNLFAFHIARGHIKREKFAVVVEGEFDAISAHQIGVKNTVAIKGTALTSDQINILSRVTDSLVLALDSDFAGEEAAKKGILLAQNFGLSIGVVAPNKKYKDPDEYIKKDREGFLKAIHSPVGVWDFIIDTTLEKFDKKSGGGKAKIGRELIPILSQIEDKIVQSHYAKILSQKLDVPFEAVSSQIEAFSKKNTPVSFVSEDEKKTVSKDQQKPRKQILEERLIALCLAKDPTILFEEDVMELVSYPLGKRILEELKLFLKENEDFVLSTFAKNIPSELIEGLSEIILKDVGLPGEASELSSIKKELTMLFLKEKLNSLAQKIQKYEKEKDKSSLKSAEEEFSKTSKLLSLQEEV